jgi:hypothetical protein
MMHYDIEAAEPRHHLVQFYRSNESALAENITRYFAEGLRRGEGCVAVAAAGRREALMTELQRRGADLPAALRQGRFIALDAQETLARFMVDGQPDWEAFDSTVGATIRAVRERTDFLPLRAYGEMVGILWQAGERAAAVRLEEYWNTLLNGDDFSLLCGYPIDIFSDDFEIRALDAVLCAHTHVLPGGDQLDAAIEVAMDEVLGLRANGLKSLMKANFRPSWAQLPASQARILWLRNNLPEYAGDILTRARQHYDGAAAL